jgi:gluconate 2-dehydrogenase alpha chain
LSSSGTSHHYDGNSWRFHPWDFKARSETIKRYGAGAIPKGTTLEDWPLSYDDLETYFDTVEHEIGISGKAGNIQGKIDPKGNVFEGPRQREYPMPPIRDTDFTDMMQAAARKLGWNPHRSPAAINSQPYQGRPACVYHGFCDTGGCPIRAKNSTAFNTIPAAQKTKNLTIVERAHVTRIQTDNNGKVSGVQYLKDGQEYFQPAKAVVLSAQAHESRRQETFLRENLKLRLLNARLALMARQFEAAQADLKWAQGAIERYFNRGSKRTQVAAEMLRQVAQQARGAGVARPDDTLAALATAGAPR